MWLIACRIGLQSLKETFADNLPGEIEKIKKLRKYAYLGPSPYHDAQSLTRVGSMATRSLARSLSTRPTVVPVA